MAVVLPHVVWEVGVVVVVAWRVAFLEHWEVVVVLVDVVVEFVLVDNTWHHNVAVPSDAVVAMTNFVVQVVLY